MKFFKVLKIYENFDLKKKELNFEIFEIFEILKFF